MTTFIKNITRFLAIAAITTAVVSCDDDTFSPIVEVEIPKHTPRLVIRADWEMGSDSLAVFVSTSRGVLDKTKANFSRIDSFVSPIGTTTYFQEYYDTVPNTKVELFRNDQLLGVIPYFDKGYHVAKKLFKLDSTSGVTYKIRVSAPNYETVEAVQKTQKRLTVLRGGYKLDGAVARDPDDIFGNLERGDEFTIDFQDHAEDENVYTIESFDRTYSFRRPYLYLTRDTFNRVYFANVEMRHLDPSIDDNTYLPDRSFNGKAYTWRFWVAPKFYMQTKDFKTPPPFSTPISNLRLRSGDRVNVRIRSSPRDLMLFTKSLNLARNSADNPFFTEPVSLHTNVKNGYGIFTLSSTQAVTLTIP